MHLFQQIESILYGGNYEVSLFDRVIDLNERFVLQEAVDCALGQNNIVIGGQVNCSKVEALQEISEKLTYPGDEDHGPRLDEVKARQFQELLAQYIAYLNNWIDEDDFILSFWIKENHPAYLVFWDYAFYVESARKKLCRILIGSSSD